MQSPLLPSSRTQGTLIVTNGPISDRLRTDDSLFAAKAHKQALRRTNNGTEVLQNSESAILTRYNGRTVRIAISDATLAVEKRESDVSAAG
ncbi:hypothetical protein PAE9249_02287 [Paenibacillus sp. CECT 9249]|nr:hypothetical protein PAE9249_02287 [Paenibacillus sp. CECT 9249]